MKCDIDFDAVPGCVVITESGLVDVQVLCDLVDVTVDDERWRLGTDVLIDQSQLQQSTLTAAELQTIDQRVLARSDSLRESRVVFVETDDFGRDTARRHVEPMIAAGAIRDGAVVGSRAAALAWLREHDGDAEPPEA